MPRVAGRKRVPLLPPPAAAGSARPVLLTGRDVPGRAFGQTHPDTGLPLPKASQASTSASSRTPYRGPGADRRGDSPHCFLEPPRVCRRPSARARMTVMATGGMPDRGTLVPGLAEGAIALFPRCDTGPPCGGRQRHGLLRRRRRAMGRGRGDDVPVRRGGHTPRRRSGQPPGPHRVGDQPSVLRLGQGYPDVESRHVFRRYRSPGSAQSRRDTRVLQPGGTPRTSRPGPKRAIVSRLRIRAARLIVGAHGEATSHNRVVPVIAPRFAGHFARRIGASLDVADVSHAGRPFKPTDKPPLHPAAESRSGP